MEHSNYNTIQVEPCVKHTTMMHYVTLRLSQKLSKNKVFLTDWRSGLYFLTITSVNITGRGITNNAVNEVSPFTCLQLVMWVGYP